MKGMNKVIWLIWVSMLVSALAGFLLGITAHTCCVDSGHCTDCYWSGTTTPIGNGRCEGNLDMTRTRNYCNFAGSWYAKCTDEFGTDCCKVDEYMCDANRDGNYNTCRRRTQVPMSYCR
jgi:hypothetical protein